VNMTQMFDEQARHISYIIAETARRGGRTVEPTDEAQEAWVNLINSFTAMGAGFAESCTPGYYNNEGAPREAATGTYLPGINAFSRLLEDWRAKGDMEGLEIDRPA
jgi:cyclohexanone monooxygenase